MSDHEKRIRAEVRSYGHDHRTTLAYVRGLLQDDGSGAMMAVWALNEHRQMMMERSR